MKKKISILTPNETEAAILAGLPPGRLQPAQAAQLGKELQKRGAKTEKWGNRPAVSRLVHEFAS